MRIALSLHPMIHHYQRGIHFYIKYLVENLVLLDQENEYLLYYTEREKEEISCSKGNFQFIPFQKTWHSLPPFFRWMWEFALLPREIRKYTPHMLHIPDLSFTFYSGRLVFTVHDITPFLYPEYLPSRRERIKYRGKLLSLKKAKKIITISNSTRKDLVNFLRIPPGRITVIPYGVEEKFRLLPQEKARRMVEERFLLKENFILYVGALSPNKNVSRLLEAFSLLIERGIRDYSLVIVASLNSPFYPSLARKARKLGIDRKVRWLGSQSQETLVYLYNACTLFIFPSLYEGFGLPPLEAMACGAPVVVSHTSSLPEVVGDAGVLIDPQNPEEICEAMKRILLSPSLREELRARSLERAKKFSWKRTARETLEVYRKVMGE